eukprot:957027-Rhodomonas_salina.1
MIGTRRPGAPYREISTRRMVAPYREISTRRDHSKGVCTLYLGTGHCIGAAQAGRVADLDLVVEFLAALFFRLAAVTNAAKHTFSRLAA